VTAEKKTENLRAEIEKKRQENIMRIEAGRRATRDAALERISHIYNETTGVARSCENHTGETLTTSRSDGSDVSVLRVSSDELITKFRDLMVMRREKLWFMRETARLMKMREESRMTSAKCNTPPTHIAQNDGQAKADTLEQKRIKRNTERDRARHEKEKTRVMRIRGSG
jgi:hypothetical protein